MKSARAQVRDVEMTDCWRPAKQWHQQRTRARKHRKGLCSLGWTLALPAHLDGLQQSDDREQFDVNKLAQAGQQESQTNSEKT